MATFGSVGFSGYQILSSDMGSSENVNLQGIHVTTGTWENKKQVTLPISLEHYSMGTISTNATHNLELASTTNKTPTSFKIHGAYNQGYPMNTEIDVIVIGFN